MTYNNGKYCEGVETCVYSLLEHNVMSCCTSYRGCVAAFKKNNPLNPSRRTIDDWNIQRLVLAKKQIADILLKENISASSWMKHLNLVMVYEGFHEAHECGSLCVLWLCEMVALHLRLYLLGYTLKVASLHREPYTSPPNSWWFQNALL